MLTPEAHAINSTSADYSVRGVGGHPVLSCAAESWASPRGLIVVLRVTGEIDLLTVPALSAAFDAVLDGAVDIPNPPARYLVVDLAGVTFCCVAGFVLIADTALVAAASATGYALSGCSAHFERYWRILCADRAPVRRYRSAAVAVTANRWEQQRRGSSD